MALLLIAIIIMLWKSSRKRGKSWRLIEWSGKKKKGKIKRNLFLSLSFKKRLDSFLKRKTSGSHRQKKVKSRKGKRKKMETLPFWKRKKGLGKGRKIKAGKGEWKKKATRLIIFLIFFISKIVVWWWMVC